MQTIRTLILEDDIETLSVLLKGLRGLEENLESSTPPQNLALTILSECTQVEEYINKCDKDRFDIILLDRDCKSGGSFHTLDIEKIGAEKIIGISGMPNYNEELKKRGVTKIIDKTLDDLETFTQKVIPLITRTLKETGKIK